MKPRIRVPSNEYLSWLWVYASYPEYEKATFNLNHLIAEVIYE